MNDLMNINNSIDNALETSSTLTFISAETPAEKAAFFNTLSAKSDNISEMIGETLMLTNIVFQGRNFTDEETGEVEKVIRIIFIDVHGNIYHSYSMGMLNSVKTFLTIYGTPDTWADPIPVTVERVVLKNGGQTFTLRGV